MGWFKAALTIVLKIIGRFINVFVDPPRRVNPNPAGLNAKEREVIRIEQKKEYEKERKKNVKAKKDRRLVIDGAQIKCTLCTNPIGNLVVTYDTPTIQGKKTATVKDNGKMNFLFKGTCTKSPNSAAPCAAVIQPAQWQDTGSFKVQDESPLLQKSTITCLFGGTDISIVDCGQKNIYAYDLPHKWPDDKIEQANISLTLFFDGTRNNMKNTEAREEYFKLTGEKPFDDPKWKAKANTKKANYYVQMSNKRDDSYKSGYSNVALLSKAFTKQLKNKENYLDFAYVEGIATGNRETDAYVKDSQGGYAWGHGDTGIEAKVEKGSQYGAEKLKELVSKGQERDVIKINVIGFSRGAAAARSFLKEIDKPGHAAYTTFNYYSHYGPPVPSQIPAYPKHGVWGAALEKQNIDVDNLDFKIYFAGLFDTVASHGYLKSDDVNDLGLTAVKKAKRTLHLVAADEHRYFFPSVNINSAGFMEKSFPGVHSDIGGSYVDNEDEHKKALAMDNEALIAQKIKKLIRTGWYKKEQLNVIPEQLVRKYLYDLVPKLATDILKFLERSSVVLTGDRKKMSVAYSYIPLHIMCDYALQRGNSMKFKVEQLKNEFNIDDHPKLQPIYDRLYDVVFEDAPEMTFYSRKELEQEINQIRPSGVEEEYFVAPIAKMLDTLADLEPQAGKPIIMEYFITNPKLIQKINDHNNLLWLRNEYLHQSADWLEPGFNPTQSGNRGIYNG
jgi:hypothetical protein